MEFNQVPSQEVISRTIDGLTARGVTVAHVTSKAAALEALQQALPKGTELMTGSSITLEQIGFIDQLKSKQHPWVNLKDKIVEEADPAKQAELRRQSVLTPYFIGSVHAITESGQTVTASASGSQLPSYAFTSPNVIWVAGVQKIVPNLEAGFQRIRGYVFPLEDQHMKDVGYGGSSINLMLIFERITMPIHKIHLILVDEVLGF